MREIKPVLREITQVLPKIAQVLCKIVPVLYEIGPVLCEIYQYFFSITGKFWAAKNYARKNQKAFGVELISILVQFLSPFWPGQFFLSHF